MSWLIQLAKMPSSHFNITNSDTNFVFFATDAHIKQ